MILCGVQGPLARGEEEDNVHRKAAPRELEGAEAADNAGPHHHKARPRLRRQWGRRRGRTEPRR